MLDFTSNNDEEHNGSQSLNTARSGTSVDAMHISDVGGGGGGMMPVLHQAESILYRKLVTKLCMILNYDTKKILT